MALIPGSAAHTVDAAQRDLPPRNQSTFENKVVNADIRIRSVTDDTLAGGDNLQVEELVEHSQPGAEDVSAQVHADEMRTWWNTSMKKHMNQPDGYEKVAVLLIKWAEELDQLRTKKETLELEALFRDKFHYHTNIVELNVRSKPQHQLNSHVSDFIRDHDGPHNLLIVYYTGHGSYREDKKYLELTATENPAAVTGFSKEAIANWNKVEEKFKDDEVEGDVLTILDTCYASNHVKSAKEDTRKFELLSACARNQTTAAPGDHSFTRALIDSLKEMLAENKDGPLSTFRIAQRINLDKRRDDTQAHLWYRGPNSESHIFLAPLSDPKSDVNQLKKISQTPGGYLTLRFGLRDATLNEEQIDYITGTLSKALNNKPLVGLQEVKLLEMKAAPPRPHVVRVAVVMYVVAQWKKVITRKKNDRESQLGSQKTIDSVAVPALREDSPAKPHKRSQDDFENLPVTKKRYLDPGDPPLSPPVSIEERND